jgi:predicted unusual protein kinase regulating ubiquinone biosynthesis (AarF/ABC1/UbiB family)
MAKKTIKRVKTSTLERGLSMVGVGIKGSLFAAKYALGRAQSDSDAGDKALRGAAELLASELDRLKGSLHKAGQLLSVFGEFFLPPEVTKVLEKLQAQSTPVEWNQIEPSLIRSIGKDAWKDIEIDRTPFAAASMGQVYRAKYLGQDIVLKVQYPGIDQSIDSDIKTLQMFFKLTKILPDSQAFQDIFDEIKVMLIRETDYSLERETMDLMRSRLPENGPWIIPKTYPELSSKRVLAMEYIPGLQINDPKLLELSQEKRNAIGFALLDSLFKELFVWRLIQSDAHPGNYLVQVSESGVKLVLLDYGAMRKLPEKFVSQFKKMSLCALNGDKEGVIKYGKRLDYLRVEEDEVAEKIFFEICSKSLTGFMKDYESPSLDGSIWSDQDFRWHENHVVTHMAGLASNAIFKVRMRPPPKEAIFLDRKLAGIFSILSRLQVTYGPGKLLRQYLENS